MGLFTSEDGQVRLQLKLMGESLRFTQRQNADFYEKTSLIINEHLKNIYEDGEIKSTIRKFRTVAREGTWRGRLITTA